MFLGTNTLDQFFLYITCIFVHLSVIAAACYFRVYKLIGWDPVNLYLFKALAETLEKNVGYVHS